MVFFGFFVCLFFFFLIFQILKFSLYCLYLWQIVEYRLDRFLVRISNKGDKKELLRYFNFLNFYPFNKYPKITFRTILTVFSHFFIGYQLLFLIYRPLIKSSLLNQRFVLTLFLIIIVFYYFTPLLTSLITFFFSLLLWPAKRFIVFFAKKKIEELNALLVIGITGSFGKSSTKEVIAGMLSLKYKVARTPANTNTQIGVAKTILFSLDKSHQIFVVEMGAYKRGEIEEICQLVKPKIGVLTGINAQHLALFGNLANTKAAKYELIKSLPADGLALFNARNKYTLSLSKRRRKLNSLLYGRKIKKYEEAIEAAWQIGDYLKIPKTKMRRFIPKLRKKLQFKKGKTKEGYLLFDDSYSSNPDGFFRALEKIAEYKRKKLVVTPGIIELGKKSEEIHQQLGAVLAKVADKVVITNENFAFYFKKGAKEQFEKKFLVSQNEVEILKWLGEKLNSNWVVLLEGRVPKNVISLFKKLKTKKEIVS